MFLKNPGICLFWTNTVTQWYVTGPMSRPNGVTGHSSGASRPCSAEWCLLECNKEVKPPEAEIFCSLKSPTPIKIHKSSSEKCINNNKKCSQFSSPACISTKRSIKALIHDNRAAGAKIFGHLGSKWYPIPPRGVGGCPENIPENDLGNTKHSGKYPYGLLAKLGYHRRKSSLDTPG